MRIVVLVENTSINDTFAAEHGLSLWIEYHDRIILLDAGSTDRFAENAKELGLDLRRVDAAVLSHGHYDHSGGFERFWEMNRNAACYAHAGMDGDYYSSKGSMHYIGIPEGVRRKRDRFRIVSGPTCIDENVFLVPHHTEGLAQKGEAAGLYQKIDDDFLPDDFAHEQSLVIETEKGLVVFNSCSHSGADVIIDEVKAALGKNIYAYFGGLHMLGRRNGEEICTFSPEKLDALADKIRREGLEYVYTGHCTGRCGLMELQRRLPDVVKSLSAGRIIEI